MKSLSTLVKYMHESIRHFFLKQIKNNTMGKKSITKVYRAALLPTE
jgi:hypothetical protein